MFATLIGGGAV